MAMNLKTDGDLTASYQTHHPSTTNDRGCKTERQKTHSLHSDVVAAESNAQFLYTSTARSVFVCLSSDNEQHGTLGSLNDVLTALSAHSLSLSHTSK